MQVSQNVATSVHRAAERESPLSQLLLLGKFGIAGGLAGKPIGITLRDFPPDTEMEICRRLTEKHPLEAVVVIRTAADASKLLQAPDKIRVALLPPDTKGGVGLATALELRRNTGTTLPVLLTSYTQKCQDTPAATLLFTYQKDRENELVEELLEPSASATADSEKSLPQEPVEVDTSHLIGLVRSSKKQGFKRTLANFHLLDGLLAGAAIRDQQSSTNQTDQPIVATLKHYEKVRSLLQCPLLESIHQSYDWLAVLMLKRAYLYTGLDQPKTSQVSKVGRAPSKKDKNKNGEQRSYEGPREISRVQLIELGKRNSQHLKNLVASVLNPASKDALKSLGLQESHATQILNEPSPKQQVCLALRHLPTWSDRQVRSRFSQLVRDGLIRRGSRSGNGSVPYFLPPTFSDLRSPFATLPGVAEFETEGSARS